MSSIRRALILAAGRGIPVGDGRIPNCLAEVGGIPILERTLGVLARAGIRKVGITVGWQGAEVRRRMPTLLAAEPGLDLEVTFFENQAWDRPNGISVQAARSFLTERTLLVMADQVAAPALCAEMCALPPHGDRTVLAVDKDLARVFDVDDATKARLSGGAVTAIGKDLRKYDAVSAGMFVCGPSLLEALDGLPDPSLTQGVAAAASRGQVLAHEVAGKLWQDVDTPDMRRHAEWMLRVYGDELDRAAMHTAAPPAAQGTLELIEQLLAEKDAPGHTLFNPGPVMTSARVKAALVHHDVCHRDGDYSDVVRRLQSKLRPLYGASDQHEMLLVTGSGTSAMEMAIASAVPPGKKMLVVTNGAFGDRLEEIAQLHDIPRVVVRAPWGELPDVDAVAQALEADPEIAVAAMIHCETSVGLMNPVREIGQLTHARGVTLILDAVSTLGAEEMDVVRDHVDICYSSANKCIHSASGVSFLCVAPHVWQRIAHVPPRVYYLDMKRYRRYLEDLAQTPFTPAVSAFFALEAALDELAAEGGVSARRDAYRLRNLRIRRVFTSLGFESFTNTGREAHTISTLRVPAFITVDDLYDRLKDKGFIIYRCKGPLGDRHIQVANMGDLDDTTIDAFLTAVTQVVESARPALVPSRDVKLRSV